VGLTGPEDVIRADPFAFEVLGGLVAKYILAQSDQHGHVCFQAGSGDGLVCAFASRAGRKRPTQDRLPGRWHVRGAYR
jgi:hypothetical protein